MGVRFPGWLGKSVSLQLKECRNITQLGSSGDGDFPNLKTLHIWRCPRFSSAPTSIPVLEDLHVENIKVSNVRDIISIANNSLRCLWLEGVSGMNSLSDVTESSSLLSCLNKLSIVFCEDLREIPSSTLECCRSLESLQVWGCRELVSFPLNLQQTPSLSRITLWGCQKLFTRDAALPRGFEHLTNLKELRIWSDESVQSIDWDGLKRGCSTTLRELVMYRSRRTQLPHQLKHFSSLLRLLRELDDLELRLLRELDDLELRFTRAFTWLAGQINVSARTGTA